MSVITTYVLAVPGRPLLVNKERTMHFQARSKELRPWREAFSECATTLAIPLLDQINVIACPWLRGRRGQDVGACLPSVKAAIDGLVDAGVLVDDTPDHVRSLTFLPPSLGAEQDELVLTLEVLA